MRDGVTAVAASLARARQLLRGTAWDSFLGPIGVNLTTALLLFLSAAIFQGQIRHWFGLADFPLYCVTEPRMSGDSLQVEVWLVNLTSEELGQEDLVAFVRQTASEDATRTGPEIKLNCKGDFRLTWFRPDSTLNATKGDMQARGSSESSQRTIVFTRIGPRGVLKGTFGTNSTQRLRRDSKVSLEDLIEVDYAGK